MVSFNKFVKDLYKYTNLKMVIFLKMSLFIGTVCQISREEQNEVPAFRAGFKSVGSDSKLVFLCVNKDTNSKFY